MKFQSACALLLLLAGLALPANASVILSIDSQNAVLGATTVSMPVRFNGSGEVSALSMMLQIGDGGAYLGGVETFQLIGFDGTGSIFDPEKFDLDFSPGLPNAAIKINISPKNDFPGIDVPANGLIGSLLIDISSATDLRTVTIHPTGVDGEYSPYLKTKAQDSSLDNVPLTFTSGQLNIVAVPEPGALTLLTGFGTLLLKRRRAK